jgi:CHAT domain-containing protein
MVNDPAKKRESTATLETQERTAQDSAATDMLTRSASDIGMMAKGAVYLPRLLSTRQEAKSILALASAGQSMQALDFDASRATAISPDLAQYRIVHFATHGMLNSEHPELSGLVLSLVNRQGKQQNGFLGLEDIYNLNLPADLVVLSACETGLGQEIQGEGLVGLTRAFMYAGAPRVVASLWRVPDRATAELMKQFYSAMLVDGLPPAAALRQAQVNLSRDKRWSAPYYWAGFTLQGEWK